MAFSFRRKLASEHSPHPAIPQPSPCRPAPRQLGYKLSRSSRSLAPSFAKHRTRSQTSFSSPRPCSQLRRAVCTEPQKSIQKSRETGGLRARNCGKAGRGTAQKPMLSEAESQHRAERNLVKGIGLRNRGGNKGEAGVAHLAPTEKALVGPAQKAAYLAGNVDGAPGPP